MITNFNEQLFVDFQDINIAVMIENIAYWIRKNASNERHFNEGRYWSYNSYPAFAKMFPGWSTKVIRTIISKCVKKGLLIIGNFNKKSYDNTNWYTLTDKALEYFPQMHGLLSHTPAQTGRPPAQTGRPIPKQQTQLSNINITNSESVDSPVIAKKAKTKIDLSELIEIYRVEFPDNPQPHKRLISTSLRNVLLGLIKRWPEIDPLGRQLDYEAFRRYLQQLKIGAPKFALGEYTTKEGNIKKNGLETFCRFNTVVKFLENCYS